MCHSCQCNSCVCLHCMIQLTANVSNPLVVIRRDWCWIEGFDPGSVGMETLSSSLRFSPERRRQRWLYSWRLAHAFVVLTVWCHYCNDVCVFTWWKHLASCHVFLCVRWLRSCYEILMRCWCSCFVRFWLIRWVRPDRHWCTRMSRWARAVQCYGTCCSAPTSSSSTRSPTKRWAHTFTDYIMLIVIKNYLDRIIFSAVLQWEFGVKMCLIAMKMSNFKKP